MACKHPQRQRTEAELDDLLQQLWANWSKHRPAHEALYFDFHEKVVRQHHELTHLSLVRTLQALMQDRVRPSPKPPGTSG